MTQPEDRQPHPVDMWAICDPQGNVMDSTVMLKQKDAIYNGTVWGRCGDNRTLAEFKKEGYRVIRVRVVPVGTPKDDPAAIAAAARAEGYEQGKRDALLSKDNLAVSSVVAFEAGLEEGVRQEREKQYRFSSTEMLLLGHDEWKRREERRHLHPEDHWVAGFINGFLTDKKWAREYVDKLLRSQQPGGEDGGAGK